MSLDRKSIFLLLALYLSIMFAVPSPISMSSLWPTFMETHGDHPLIQKLGNLLPAATSVGICLSGLFNGKVVARIGWRGALLLGLSAHALLGSLSKYLFHLPLFYLLARFSIGYFISLVIISSSMGLAAFEKRFRLRYLFACQNLFFGFGGATLSSLARLLAQNHWGLVHLIHLLTLVPFLLLLKQKQLPQNTEESKKPLREFHGPTLTTSAFLFLFLAAFCTMEVSASQYTFLPYQLANAFSFAPEDIAKHHRLYFLLETLGSLSFPFLLKWLPNALGMVTASILMGGTFLLLIATHYSTIQLFTILCALTVGVLIPYYHLMVAARSPESKKESFFGYLSTSFSLGEFFIPALGALFLDDFTGKAGVTLLLACTCVLASLVLFYKKRTLAQKA